MVGIFYLILFSFFSSFFVSLFPISFHFISFLPTFLPSSPLPFPPLPSTSFFPLLFLLFLPTLFRVLRSWRLMHIIPGAKSSVACFIVQYIYILSINTAIATVLYCNVTYSTVYVQFISHCIAYFALYYIVTYYMILYCTILYCTVLYYIVLYRTVL